MEQDGCSSCGGKLRKGNADFIVQVGNDIIVIKKVPALICEDCGYKYHTPDVSRKIDVVMKKYYESKRLHAGHKKLTEQTFNTVPALETELPA